MSKYEKAIKAQHTAALVRRDLMRATRRKADGSVDLTNDKGVIQWNFLKSHEQEATLALHAGHGQYGSSSFYSITGNQAAVRYLGEAATNLSRAIADEAIRLAEQYAKRLATEAAEEAQKILDAVKEE